MTRDDCSVLINNYLNPGNRDYAILDTIGSDQLKSVIHVRAWQTEDIIKPVLWRNNDENEWFAYGFNHREWKYDEKSVTRLLRETHVNVVALPVKDFYKLAVANIGHAFRLYEDENNYLRIEEVEQW